MCVTVFGLRADNVYTKPYYNDRYSVVTEAASYAIDLISISESCLLHLIIF